MIYELHDSNSNINRFNHNLTTYQIMKNCEKKIYIFNEKFFSYYQLGIRKCCLFKCQSNSDENVSCWCIGKKKKEYASCWKLA